MAANSTGGVLICGEPGVGKELFAQAIHNASARARQPFLSVNCANAPRALLPSELFGIEGDENGSRSPRPGKLELADGGVLFLEEIGALPFELQTSLLRTIETRHTIRNGGVRPIAVDVRIIAAASEDLDQLIAAGRFRADLAVRLRQIVVEVPPLRSRTDDLLLMIDSMLRRLNDRLGKQSVLAPEVLSALQAYAWPGNVRELELVLERLVDSCEQAVITAEELPEPFNRLAGANVTPAATLTDAHDLADIDAIVRAGRQARGHLGHTARLLGISRTTLWRKMARYGLQKDHFWRA